MKKCNTKKIISLLMCLTMLLTFSLSLCAEAVSTYMVYLPSGDGYSTQAVPGYSIFNLDKGSSFRFTLTLNQGYDQSVVSVFANGSPLSPVSGQYIVSNIQSDVEVTVSGVTKNTYSVTLPDTDYCTFAPAPGYSETGIVYGSAFKFVMNVKAPYTQSKPVVYLNGNELVPDKNNTYVIDGITQNITGITVSEVPLNTYTLKFFNENGTPLWQTTAYHGQIVDYGGAAPVKEADAQWVYEFTGWSPSLIGADGDTSYTAVFSKQTRYYTVRFLNYDGSVLETYKVPYNGSATCSVIPERPDDDTGAFSFVQFDVDTSSVKKDIDSTARFTHKHVFRHFLIKPTCIESGYTYDYCLSCGYSNTYDHTYALGHEYSPWVNTVLAADTTEGLKVRVCTRDGCGNIEQEVVPAGTVYPVDVPEGEEEEEPTFFEKLSSFFSRLIEKIKALFIVQ